MDRANRIAGLACIAAALGCGSPTSPKQPDVRGETAPREFALPGASGPVTVDFIAYERDRDRVWIPVGETGSVDVFDIASTRLRAVDGFKTQEREVRGRKRTMGPSSVTFGEGVAFVGNRASNEICAIDRDCAPWRVRHTRWPTRRRCVCRDLPRGVGDDAEGTFDHDRRRDIITARETKDSKCGRG